MIKGIRFPRIFFGWWTVISGGVLTLWISGYQWYGFSALFKPIAEELDFTRTTMSIPSAIGRLEGGLEGPLAGWATDRFGARNVMLLGVFLVGLSLILMYFINSLWAFYIVWGVLLGTGNNISTTIPVDTAITNWFVKKRGIALGTKMVFSGLSGTLVLPLIAFLIDKQGWRITCLIGGIVTLVVGLPLVWFFIKPRRPEYYGLLPDGATVEKKDADTTEMISRGIEYAADAEEVEFTLRQAMRTRAYWLLISANVAHGLVAGAFIVHLIPYLTDIGIDPVKAAGMTAIMAFSGLPTRFFTGFIIDRLSRNHIRFVIAGGYFLQATGYAVFLLNQKTMPIIYLWLILYGLGMGTAFITNVMVARYYGRKAFGSIRGSQMAFMAGPGVVAPIYAGWVYDTTGSYITAFTTFGIALAVSTVVMAMTAPPKPPAHVADIHEII